MAMPDDKMMKAADGIMLEATERLERDAGVPAEDVPHAFIGAGLAMLDADLCPQCLVETLKEVREEIDAKIAEAQERSQGRHVHH